MKLLPEELELLKSVGIENEDLTLLLLVEIYEMLGELTDGEDVSAVHELLVKLLNKCNNPEDGGDKS